TSCGWISSCASALLTALRIPKSPHPGHHVTLIWLLKVLRSSMHLSLLQFLDDVLGAERAAVPPKDHPVGPATGHRPHQVGELAALVSFHSHQLARGLDQRGGLR